ncbi:TonB-dependent receptor [Alteromonas ponticola]|uniref:TonB-dependent receptor n=1 Tax=Alteromonas ponticola TaxID=2720613 RepID=A0ABX1R4M8_9ALTE|nr:TonB-dependent receptor [Alteromonas ponticola]NMH61400.1 TonB-dependent receptor [Alteromonas ponticola]
MFAKSQISRVAIAVAMSVGMATSAMAQETSSSVRGTITGPNGNPAPGSVITITHVPSGSTKTVTVGEEGSFNVSGLRVGGPYTIAVDSQQFKDATYEDISLSLGKPFQIDVQLDSGENVETIVVSASTSSLLAFNNVRGPAANFSQEQIENSPAINRAITDIVRIDPRIYVSEGNDDGDTIQCAGKNRRFNSFTVDGVRMDDIFGLSDTGLPTNRFPFSFDALEQVSVELAPFDVVYGGFSACTINSVIKSGSNEVHGSVFYDYTDDSLRGDSLEGEDIVWPEYEEKRYGLTIGGPLIKDKLFFFAAYEKLEGADVYEGGVVGSGAANASDFVTQSQLDEIISIAQNLYQYDPGAVPTDLQKGDEKYLIKLDWNINANHRSSLTYINSEDFNTTDSSFYDVQLESNLYREAKELSSLSASVYSDWNDYFSTEVRFTSLSVDNDNAPLFGTDFANIGVLIDGDRAVTMGGDVFRQNNRVEYGVDTFAIKGNYYLDDGSTITAGIERETIDVFNLFGRYSESEIIFDSIDDFRAGIPSSFEYENAATGDVNDVAGAWEYSTNTLYAQYDFEPLDMLRLVVGLRYDEYDTSDTPTRNPLFEEDYGFSNAQTLDGVSLLQPRVSFTYDLADDIILRGGLGLYSGGNPAVWLTNSFVRTGGKTFATDDAGLEEGQSLFDVPHSGAEEGRPSSAGWGIPTAAYNEVNSNLGSFSEFADVNYLDPDFDMPSEWKLSLGTTHTLTDDISASFDILLSQSNDALMVKRGDLDPVVDANGNQVLTEQGLPAYESNRIESYVVTNASEDAFSYILSAGFAGQHDNGISWTLGYAYSDAEDVQGLVSSQAESNYQRTARRDAQGELAATSNYNIEHRLTGTLTYSHELISGFNTRFSMFAVYQSGEVYSLTEDGTGLYARRGPLGELTEDGLVLVSGAERNGEEGPSWAKVDLKVTQDLPGIMEGHKASAFIVIDNFTNLLNDDWGVLEEQDGNYQFSEVGDTPFVKQNASVYEIRFGVEYKF